MISSNVPATAKVPFSLINFTACNVPYNTSPNTFLVSQRSLYWFHLSAGVPANKMTNYKLNGLNYSSFVYSSATAYPPDQLTTDTLQWIPPNASLWVSSDQTLYSTSNYETAWFGFRLDNLFNPLVAFAVQLTQPYTTSSAIKFNRVLVNEGNGYNINDGLFTAPINGIYFFSSTTTNNIYIAVNNYVNVKLCVFLNDNAHTSSDLVSVRGSILLTLKVNDKVQIIPRVKELIRTNQDGFASFSGFVYSPIFGFKIAWSVVRKTFIMGPSDYAFFDEINTNQGNCWHKASNRVIIPVSGIYFVDLGSPHCGKGFQWCHDGDGNGDTVIQVLCNENIIVNKKLSVITYENCGVRSRATLVSLNTSDELRINVPTGGCHYSDAYGMIWFNGFLLFASV